jgi:hypothetical protein
MALLWQSHDQLVWTVPNWLRKLRLFLRALNFYPGDAPGLDGVDRVHGQMLFRGHHEQSLTVASSR